MFWKLDAQRKRKGKLGEEKRKRRDSRVSLVIFLDSVLML